LSAVARYYFHLYDDLIVRDEEGKELPDPQAAHQLAIYSARQIACSQVLEGYLNLRHRIEVEDEASAIVYTVHFADVVRVDGG
jgi:hypothetical protein